MQASRKATDADPIVPGEWVQVRGWHKGEGWIPRPVLEGMGINCSALDRTDSGITGDKQGTVWFTQEQADAIHKHKAFHDGPLGSDEGER